MRFLSENNYRLVKLASLISVTLFVFINHISINHKPLVQAQTSDTPWPMAGGNAERTSRTNATIDPDSLSPAWSTVINPHIPNKVQIIAANDTLFVSTAKGLYALRADNGAQKWFYPTNMPLGHSPTYFNTGFASHPKRVYAPGFDKKIHAIDAETGSFIWAFDGAEAGYDTNPLVVTINNRVLIYAGNRDGFEYAIEDTETNGNLIWKHETGGPIHFSTAYKSPNVYFASNDASAYAVNALTGVRVWKSPKLPTGDGFHSWWPVVNGNYLILGGSRAYRPGSGPQLGYGDLEHDILPKLDTFGVALNAQGNRVYYQDYVPNLAGHTTRNAPMTNAINYLENMPWRRSFYFINLSNGTEKTFDLDSDGKTDYAPLMNTGTNNGTRYPAMIGPDPNSSAIDEVYTFNNYVQGDYTQGVAGWKINSTTVTIPGGGQTNGDEPISFSGAGDLIFISQCCDRSARIYNPKTGGNWDLYSYDLGTKFPGYGVNASGTDEANAVRSFGNDNGIYGYHGDQNPLVPYVDSNGVGRIYFHRSNAILAFAPNVTGGATNRVLSTPTNTNTPPGVNIDSLKQKLVDEVNEIVTAGHLRPGFGVLSPWSIRRTIGDRFHDYFNSPWETIYTLTKAYENLPADQVVLKANLKTYVQNELTNFSPCEITHIGYSEGAAREDFILPPEISDSISSGMNDVNDGILSAETSSPFWGTYGTNSKSPMIYYALWKYSSVLGNSTTANQLLGSCGDIGSPIAVSSMRELPFVQNAWIAGLYGYMKLQVQAGEISNINQSNRYSSYNSLLSDRANNFNKDNTWGGVDTNDDRQNWAISRNFFYMTPELGAYLRTNALTKMQNAFNEYNYIASYWFVSRFEETFSEGIMSFPYNLPALFSAKAYIFNATREDLAQYLDVPMFPRGDLFYIQNLVATIEAPTNGTPVPTPTPASTPTPSPLLGDVNGDHVVNGMDIKQLLMSFLSVTSSTLDLDNSGKVNLMDAAWAIKQFGLSW